MPEWSKGADCKSAAVGYGGSNPPLPTILRLVRPFGRPYVMMKWLRSTRALFTGLDGGVGTSVGSGDSMGVRYEGHRWPVGRTMRGHVAQSVERILGKDEVHRFDPGRGLFHFPRRITPKNL